MRDYRIGRLKGPHVVIWTDDEGKRRRYRLEANTAREAEQESRDLILRLDAPPAGMTVAQVCREEVQDRHPDPDLRHLALEVP
nr:hypothetical protein [Rhodovulum sulfidophilum]